MALDLEKYKNMLIRERDRLTEGVGSVAEIAQPVSDDRQLDAGDAQLLGAGVDVQSSIIEMKSNRLERIYAALQSIDEGTYGICIKCGREINPARLDAEPAALTCVDCISKEEAEFKSAEM